MSRGSDLEDCFMIKFIVSFQQQGPFCFKLGHSPEFEHMQGEHKPLPGFFKMFVLVVT